MNKYIYYSFLLMITLSMFSCKAVCDTSETDLKTSIGFFTSVISGVPFAIPINISYVNNEENSPDCIDSSISDIEFSNIMNVYKIEPDTLLLIESFSFSSSFTNNSTSIDTSLTVSLNEPGSYKFKVCADVTNNVLEYDEQNNCMEM